MRIGVNAVPLRVSGGGARYVFSELMERLLTLDEQNEYVIFSHFLGLSVVNQLSAVHRHLPGSRRRGAVPIVEVSHEDDVFHHRDSFDLFFGPLNNLQPRLYDRPSVAILHDIQEQFFPEYFSPGDLQARNEIYPEICRSATVLVTISEFCKQSIVEKFGIAPEKIEVVYNAPQSRLVERPAGDDGNWQRTALPEHFLFYPANCYLHKNHALLLDALVQMRDSGRATPHVVFTGFELPGGYPLRDEIKRRELADRCQVFSEIHVDEMRYLYRHADALVMPTRFEGFGMPAVEALACGCPVVCADVPALREVAGDQALYFDPDDSAGLIEQIERITEDAALREQLARDGVELAKRYSWEQSARRIMASFDRAMSEHNAQPTIPTAAAAVAEPRIGVLITAPEGGHGVPEAIKGLWSTGYRNAAFRVALRDGTPLDEVRSFLDGASVPYDLVSGEEMGTFERLERFARENHVDLASELIAGHGAILPSGLHGVAAGFGRQPDRPVYLAEGWEQEDGRIRSVARLRLLGTGDWKLEGYLYPEMLFIAPRRLADWPEAAGIIADAGLEWRWALVREAHRSDRLGLLRRSVALCDPNAVSTLARVRALRSGVGVVHSANGQSQNGWVRGLKPVLLPMSRILPTRLREKGKQVWRHLVNG